MSAELKSCPFCGGTDLKCEPRFAERVICNTCQAYGPDINSSSKNTIYKLWNTRHRSTTGVLCPFCGSKEDVDEQLASPNVYYFQCENDCCLATGPESDTPEGAKQLWYKRHPGFNKEVL